MLSLLVLLSMSELESEMVMTVVMGGGTPSDVSGLLLLPGCLVSGLVMVKVTISGKEFLDGNDDVQPTLMSIACSRK